MKQRVHSLARKMLCKIQKYHKKIQFLFGEIKFSVVGDRFLSKRFLKQTSNSFTLCVSLNTTSKETKFSAQFYNIQIIQTIV